MEQATVHCIYLTGSKFDVIIRLPDPLHIVESNVLTICSRLVITMLEQAMPRHPDISLEIAIVLFVAVCRKVKVKNDGFLLQVCMELTELIELFKQLTSL